MTILTPILICLAVAAILGALWLFVAPQAALQATISVGGDRGFGASAAGSLGAAAPPVVSLGSLPLQDLRMERKTAKIYEKNGDPQVGRTGCRIKPLGWA